MNRSLVDLSTPTLRPATLLVAAIFFSIGVGSYAVEIGQVDDFQAGDAAGWGGASQSLTIETDGGPAGAGDRYVSYTSQGSGGPGGRMLLPHEAEGGFTQWQGDYLATGITGISFDILNPGATQLDLRLTVGNPTGVTGGTWYTSSSIVVPGGAGWQTIEFPIDDTSMTLLGSGTDSLEQVLGAVTKLRLVSSVGLPTLAFGDGAPQGDRIAASIGVDNITAIGVPEPSASLLTSVGLCVACRRRRR